ncbi:MAG: hypothetical protein J0M04_03735 [Verrucomicrobia bacterium]|nr:hypothetical protein [Verrucomicrobiota bacterium]
MIAVFKQRLMGALQPLPSPGPVFSEFGKHRALLAAALSVSLQPLAAAPSIAYNPAANTSGSFSGYTGSVGLVFTVNTPVTVTELGITTNSNEPLDSAQLKTRLYRLNDPNGNLSDATLLAERLFTAGTASSLSGIAPWGWRVFFQSPAAPVALAPGTTYVIASEGFGGSPSRAYINVPTNVAIAPEITHLASRYGAAGAVPATPDGTGVKYQGPTFRYEVGSAPVVLAAPERDPTTGGMILSWSSRNGSVYHLEGSGDLNVWQTLDPEIMAAGETTSWVDTGAVTEPRRFYRVGNGPAPISRAGFTAIAADGDLRFDRAAWLARNSLVYQSPPFRKTEAIPLGSGRVGAAMWIDPLGGLTAQINRPEGVPALSGLGKIEIPQLAGMTAAQDYQGVLSLRDGIFTQTGDGFIVTSFFRWGGEELVIDVRGADPETPVTVRLTTFPGGAGHGGAAEPITPYYALAGNPPANETTGADCVAIAGGDATGASYPGFRATQFFAVRAVGREVVAAADGNGSRVTFKPNADGSYRLVIPVKLWTGSPVNTATLKSEALAAVTAVPSLSGDALATLMGAQSAAFGANWNDTAMIRLTSADGSGRYIEQMLALDTYLRISAALTPLPAVGGGETRLFCWNPVGLFNRNHWYQNLRPINHANIASGLWRGNQGTWDWLNGWLPALKQHVQDTFPGYEGAGYPEYVDGQPGSAGSFLISQTWGTMNIAPPGTRWYTSRMMSTTLEMVGAILTEYDFRRDEAFLDTYWPLVREGMLFHRSLLTGGGLGGDGLYHYLGVNSRENNWDDDDDTPDVAGIRYLLPVVLDLAQRRGDSQLVDKLDDLVGKLPEVPTTTRTHPASGQSVGAIAFSAATRSSGHNAENPDLDAIWPANHISDASDPAWVTLANNTLDTRVYREVYDWHPTVVQAARMGRRDIYREALLAGISRFMIYPQGLTSYSGGAADVQTEFTAVQTLGAHEALVQNHDGLLRLANAWPADWEAVAWLPCEGGHRVAVEVVAGVLQAASVSLGSANPAMRIRNPWPGEVFRVRDLSANAVLYQNNGATATVAAVAGHRLLIERASAPHASLTFSPPGDFPNNGPRKLGSRTLGKSPGDTFGFANPHLFDWTLENTGGGLTNTGSVANTNLQAQGTVSVDNTLPGGTGLSLASGFLKTGVLGNLGSDLGATIRFDVKANTASGYRRLVDYCVPGSNCDPGFLVDLTPANKVRFICSGQVATSGVALPLDTWATVAVTYRAGQSVTITINGTPEVIPVSGDLLNLSSDTLHLSIGADLNGGSRFTGSIARVRIDAGTGP